MKHVSEPCAFRNPHPAYRGVDLITFGAFRTTPPQDRRPHPRPVVGFGPAADEPWSSKGMSRVYAAEGASNRCRLVSLSFWPFYRGRGHRSTFEDKSPMQDLSSPVKGGCLSCARQLGSYPSAELTSPFSRASSCCLPSPTALQLFPAFAPIFPDRWLVVDLVSLRLNVDHLHPHSAE